MTKDFMFLYIYHIIYIFKNQSHHKFSKKNPGHGLQVLHPTPHRFERPSSADRAAGLPEMAFATKSSAQARWMGLNAIVPNGTQQHLDPRAVWALPLLRRKGLLVGFLKKKNGFKGFGGVKGGLPKKYWIDKQLMLGWYAYIFAYHGCMY